ncbi:hypothetical protein SAMN05660359_00574 [Geodermatophilus obscurus]|uniref:Uncharacterized protein n=1 Tax=Geodermatophilus obscurus TaxID=1861 RepID=A0A1I5CV86_9ACTN|nr:hypothetical protein [Geodermatophilus obscurus]SFN90869.1 hypothetical protein SAMN05660359_00574 [Geodermatophilus obscurus]
MRRKIVLATAAGVLTLGGLAVAVPALADDETPTPSAASAEERIRDALSGLVDDGSLTQEQADEVATTLDDAGVAWGGHHGWGGDRGGAWGGLSVAAETLGLTEDELLTALEADGATLASVAEDQGVAVSDLVAALVGEARERITAGVEEGHIPQERADEVLADLEARVTEAVESADVDGAPWNGRWGPWGDRDGD